MLILHLNLYSSSYQLFKTLRSFKMITGNYYGKVSNCDDACLARKETVGISVDQSHHHGTHKSQVAALQAVFEK